MGARIEARATLRPTCKAGIAPVTDTGALMVKAESSKDALRVC